MMAKKRQEEQKAKRDGVALPVEKERPPLEPLQDQDEDWDDDDEGADEAG
jgi:hypothetical protein